MSAPTEGLEALVDAAFKSARAYGHACVRGGKERGKPYTRIEAAAEDLADAFKKLRTALQASPAGRETDAARDACEVCYGHRGGVPGNENRVDGIVMCDYCHAIDMRLSALRGRETGQRIEGWVHRDYSDDPNRDYFEFCKWEGERVERRWWTRATLILWGGR